MKSSKISSSAMRKTKGGYPELFAFSRVLLVFLFLAFGMNRAWAQTPPSGRPKIGVALSGGAAKGFAHIGALKVLEEAGLRPDYIAGTSMGSIIGGLYAMGYTADSLERMALDQDWDKVLSDRIPLRDVIFEEKPFFHNQLIELPFYKGKLRPPSGLIQGQQIEALLARLTLPAFFIEDFDDLPVPFRCMAADIISGLPVELSKGSLPRAMRTSMAIPSVFTPVVGVVDKDTSILVDGGIIRNFPVQELKAMGADIVIGIYVGAEPRDLEKMGSLSGILSQVAFLASIQDAEAQMPYLDYYIEPDMSGFGPQDFKRAAEIIEVGEKAARSQFEAFKRLADSLAALSPSPPRKTLPRIDEVRLDRIEVDGNKAYSSAEIIGRSGLIPGMRHTPNELERAVNNLYGTNYFEKVSFSLRQEEGSNMLTFHIVEKSPALLRAALTYDSYHEAGFLFSVTLRNVLAPASRLMFVGHLTNNHRYRLNYLNYLDREQLFSLFAQVQYNKDLIPFYSDGILAEQYRLRELPIEFRLQRRFGLHAMLGIGGQLELLSFRPSVSAQPLFDRVNYQNLAAAAVFEVNTLDRNVLPRAGSRLTIRAKWSANLDVIIDNPRPVFRETIDSLFNISPYPSFSIHSEKYWPLHGRAGLVTSPFASVALSRHFVVGDYLLLGGPDHLGWRSIPFFGLEPNVASTQTALGAGLAYQQFLRDNLLLAFHFNAGWFGEAGTGARFSRPDQFYSGAGVSVALNSLLGPVRLSAAYPFQAPAETRRRARLFLHFGHRF
jgi:NTE family protein